MSASRRKRAAVVGVLVLGAIATASTGPARAEAIRRFDIAAGDLGGVLTQIGAASGRAIAFPAALTRGLRAGPIRGTETARAAIAAALAGTGLVQVGGETGPVTIRAKRRTDAAATDPVAAPRATPGDGSGSASAGGAGLDLPDVDVVGDRARFGDRGFQAGDAGQTTRLGNAPAREVPIAVTSVTRDVLQSQSLVSPTQALINVSGVTIAPTNLGTNSFTIRGFNTNMPYVDGDPSSGSLYARVPIDDIERVDVLKGPTSLLTGVSAEGGLVNLVTKAPTDRTIRDVTVRYGSFGYKTLAFDLGGVVPQTEGLTYRLNMSGNVADKSYAGYRSPHEYLLAPVVRWQDETFDVLVGGRYFDVKSALPLFTFVPADKPLDETAIIRLPRGVLQGGPNLSLQTSAKAVYSDQAVALVRTRDFDLTFHNHVSYQDQSTSSDLFAWSLLSSSRGNEASFIDTRVNASDIAERSDVSAVYDGGAFKQTSKVGYDFLSLFPRATSASSAFFRIDPATGLPVRLPSGRQFPFQYVAHSTVSGAYYLEKFDTLNDRLHIVGSVRDDRFAATSSFGPGVPPIKSAQYGLSWIAGGAFDLMPALTVYGNRSNGFVAQTVVSTRGQAVPPQGRDGSEIGARVYLFDKRLTLSTSVFTLKQTNVAVPDPNDPTGTLLLFVANQTSRGLEVEAQGEITDGLKVIAAFADVHAAFDFGSGSTASLLQATPQLTGSVWATYAVQAGPLASVSFGIGAHGNSRSTTAVLPSDLPSSLSGINFPVAGYVVEDAMIGYGRDDYSLTLKVNNITDRTFYYPSISTDQIVVGEGRNFLLVGRKSF